MTNVSWAYCRKHFPTQWLLSSVGLNCMGPLYEGFFQWMYIYSWPSVSWVLHPQIQLWITNSIFDLRLGICGCRGPTMHCLMLLYIRDLSVCEFGICRWSWNQSWAETKGWQVLGETKVMCVFLNIQRFVTPNPCVFKSVNCACRSNHLDVCLSTYTDIVQIFLNKTAKIKIGILEKKHDRSIIIYMDPLHWIY